MYAIELQTELQRLQHERALELATDGPVNLLLLTELDDEIEAAHAAYVGAAVTEIACLRAELSGQLNG